MQNGETKTMDTEEQKILVCEDSDVGILTGIYEAYERKVDHNTTYLQVGEEENMRLFSSYIEIIPSKLKAEKVIRTIERRFGRETLQIILEALGSTDREKGQAVYQMIVFGLKGEYKGKLIDCLSCDAVVKVVALSTTVWHEYHHLYGFVRFQELENGILYAVIHPKNHVLVFLGDHFSNRFPKEHFMIYDEVHGICLIHGAHKKWFIVDAGLLELDQLPEVSAKELQIQKLFRYFCQKISITERENLSLQQQMLPLRFRPDMVEFQ